MKFYSLVHTLKTPIPFLFSHVQAGFPSPADDYTEEALDIKELLQIDSATSFFVRVTGVSMIKTGIMPEDILSVRRDLEPENGDVVIVYIDGELTVKTLRKQHGRVVFESANDDFPHIVPTDMQDVRTWGVVTGLARILKRKK